MSRPRPTAVDYVVIAISPALIMTLVGSLALFLARVSYQGQYSARLNYILGLFVFSAVLISRISIESGKGRAILFALPLAIVTGLAAMRFGEIRGPLAGFSWLMNFVLISAVWWCTHNLTLDCTVLDDSQVQSEQGLLQLIGLDGQRENLPADSKKSTGVDNKSAGAPRIWAWWKRLANPRQKRQTHGVWVVYFSMAALPLFGVGQWFIPPSDAAGRRYTFILLCIYLLSGFGLLVTTALISLRQYLRQRNLQMPNSMVKTWIGAGITLVVVVLAAVWLLPRSMKDFEITQAPPFGSSDDLKTTDNAFGTDGPRHEPKASRVNEQLEGGSKTRSERGKEKTEKEDQGDIRDGKGNGKSSDTGEGSNGDKDKPDPSGHQQSSDGGNDGESSNGDTPSRHQKNDSDQHAAATDENEPVQPQAAKEVIQSVVAGVWNLLKYAFYALLALIAFCLAWKHREELRTAWREMLADLRDLWNRLVGRRRPSGATADASNDSDTPPPKAFATFTDPFLSDTAAKMSAEQLIRYSFAALEAWAREHSSPRDPQQTPTEFADRLADRFELLSGAVHDLCTMYCHAAYASRPVSKELAMKLDGLWDALAQKN